MMIKKRKTLFILIACGTVLLAAAVIFWLSSREEPEQALLKIMSDRVDLQVNNVRYTEVGDSGMKWEVVAAAARYQKKDNLVFFDAFKVRLVMKDGSTYIMNGDRGKFNTESKDMEIEGNVGIVSPLGDRFTTDRLRYWNADKKIETDQPVVLEGRGVRISGVGMVFLLSAKKVSLLSQVRAQLQAQ